MTDDENRNQIICQCHRFFGFAFERFRSFVAYLKEVTTKTATPLSFFVMEWPTVTRATYNICSDRLKVWFAERLPRPEYDEAKHIGFVWWPGSKCLTCVWRPAAEDFITSRGIEIEDDDQPDDTEARVERFSKYAANAEQSANSAADYINSGRANTERRRRLGLNRAENEADRAAHWNHRIKAAIRHAAFKERPDVIARRIAELEADHRRHTASFTPHRDEKGEIIRSGSGVIVGPKGGRGRHWVEESELPKLEAYACRWLTHIDDRLLYERAALAAAGGIQAQIASPEGVTFEIGGAIQYGGHWFEVTKVNPSTVEVFGHKWQHAPQPRHFKLDRTEIADLATKLRVDAGEIALRVRAPKREPKKIEKATDKSGNRPEVLGAFGSSSTFYDDLSKPVDRWWLITKVNAKTVEYLAVEIYHTSEGERRRFYIKKTDIRAAGRFITAAQVVADHPALLQEWRDLEELRAKIAAKKSEQTQTAA